MFCLVREYNPLWFPHLTTLLSIPLLLLFLFSEILWCRIIVNINCDANTTNNGHIIFCRIRNFSWWQNRQVAFFVTPVKSVLCPCATNQLHEIPLTSRRFFIINKTLLGTLLYYMNVTPLGKELNSKEFSMEEIIHCYFQPLPPQAPITLHNQNQTLKLVPLWYICVSLADRTTGMYVPWNTPCHGTKYRSELWHLSCNVSCPLVHKFT